MTKTELLRAIAHVKKKLLAAPKRMKSEAYDAACGCVMPETWWAHPSIRFFDLPLVSDKGFEFAQSIGESFYVRTHAMREDRWITILDHPDYATPKRLAHVITRTVDWGLLQRLDRALGRIGCTEEQETEPSTEDAESLWDLEAQSSGELDPEQAEAFEALLGLPATIEDPITGLTRTLRLGDDYQILIQTHRDRINELDELYEEEPKDERFDLRELEWSWMQDDPRYGKYAGCEESVYHPAPYRPILCATTEWNETKKREMRDNTRAISSVRNGKTFYKNIPLFRGPRQQVHPEGEEFVPVTEDLDAEYAIPSLVARKRKPKTKEQIKHELAMAQLPDNPPSTRKGWPKIPRIKKTSNHQPRTVTHYRPDGSQHRFRTTRTPSELNLHS